MRRAASNQRDAADSTAKSIRKHCAVREDSSSRARINITPLHSQVGMSTFMEKSRTAFLRVVDDSERKSQVSASALQPGLRRSRLRE
jgi:hypothetical protein